MNDRAYKTHGNARPLPVGAIAKQCTQCQEWKPLNAFSKAPQLKAGLKSYCKVCGEKYRDKVVDRKASRNWKAKNPEYQRTKRAALRLEVISALGGTCVNCTQSFEGFLTIDHVNNDGAEHRKIVPSSRLCAWLKRNNYPPGFQLLCWNCNCFKGCRGFLPDGKSLVATPVLPIPEPQVV